MTGYDIFCPFIVVVLFSVSLGVFISIFVEKRNRKKHNKWVVQCFTDHPELRVLLFEYQRHTNEEAETYRELRQLESTLDDLYQQAKYLPKDNVIWKNIEILQNSYEELSDIYQEMHEEKKKAEEELTNFWETNYPEVSSEQYVMWWSE